MYWITEKLGLLVSYLNVDRVDLLVAFFALLVSAYSSVSARKNVNAANRSASASEESAQAAQRSASAAEDQAGTAATQARQAGESVEVAKEQNVDAKAPRVLVRPVKPVDGWKWGIVDAIEKDPPAPCPSTGAVASRTLSDLEYMRNKIFFVVPVTLYNDGGRTARIYSRWRLHFYEGRHPTKDQVVTVPEFSSADDCFVLYPQQFAYLELRPFRTVYDLVDQIEREGPGDDIFAVCQIHALPGVETLPMRLTELKFSARPVTVAGKGDNRKINIQSTGLLDIIPHTNVQR